jgi:hypothetical protein
MTLVSRGGFMAAESRSRDVGRFRVSVARLMMLVGVVAVLSWAWLYRRDHADIERSWVSIRLRELDQSEPIQRRWAAEQLERAEAEDVARVVSGLAVAVGDPDWQVRRTAARSVAKVLERAAAKSKRVLIEEIARAMRALVPALDDACAEVRVAAMRSVGDLGAIG